jgi:glycosyltransferase involved in cell wall biosynthesis
MNSLRLVAIITYRRPLYLDGCLKSLFLQSSSGPRILVLDNDINKTALPIVEKWMDKLPITYVQEPKKGAPAARNTALAHCKTGWLAFIDDDAVADKHWIKYARNALEKLPQNHSVGFIVGQSGLANPTSSAARAQYVFHQRWFHERIQGNVASPEILDTKNCLLNCSAIHRHGIAFDDRFVTDGSSGLEDTDFGKLLCQKGYQGLYERRMKVDHFEKDLYSGLLRKAYLRGVLRYRFDKKWKVTDPWIENAPNLRVYLPPYFRNLIIWKQYLRWVVRNLNNWSRESGLRVALTQELYLAFFNLGYFDERRKLKASHKAQS